MNMEQRFPAIIKLGDNRFLNLNNIAEIEDVKRPDNDPKLYIQYVGVDQEMTQPIWLEGAEREAFLNFLTEYAYSIPLFEREHD